MFLENILGINNLFAMTSFGAKTTTDWGMYKVHGQVHHKIGHGLCDTADEANFAQVT